MEYKCSACGDGLEARFLQNEFWVVASGADNEIENVAANKKSRIEPTQDIESSLKLAENQELDLAFRYAQQGNHQETINWLTRLMGSAPCPVCGEKIRLAFNDYWFEA